jgi:hypothetical protein
MSGEVVTPDGSVLEFVAIYHRYHVRYEVPFPTPEDAARMLYWGEEEGQLSSGGIRYPDGHVLTSDSEIARMAGDTDV